MGVTGTPGDNRHLWGWQGDELVQPLDVSPGDRGAQPIDGAALRDAQSPSAAPGDTGYSV